ncbi:alpha/beta hydrolase [Elizabethkingia meningoseptica]|uniref:alpha/beta fold hydrolase n=1 Tax=Elizabethkingia meningoseptica TaxID=238 RepID=UPI0022F17D6D|nr:alpha/beta hydrolase [Elizabethkingia meningoseptica]EJK5328130.1 alpha/beta hydrolase [Elizabethkingia meningoseptica]MCT3897510.1 alpha/beta hydrolase [Elizabethkingia anophelis]MCT4122311.1 alpha/beta hydrolase [Elizabethkingia anophelis]WBS74106.1 alpha/beta hydrolase [Elizabethkingia meningoseptica]
MEKTYFKSSLAKKNVLKAYDMALDKAKKEISQKVINTKFGKTHILESGKNNDNVMILLHGAASNASSWIPELLYFSKQYKVLAIDIIGEAGKSDENRLSFQSNDYSEWLHEIFSILTIKKAIIIGLSQGGWLAQKFSINSPEKIKALILLTPAGVVPSKIGFVAKAIFLSLFGERGRKKINRIVLGKQYFNPKIVEFMDLIQTNFNARIEKEYLFTDMEIQKLTMPIFLIGGEKDSIRSAIKINYRLENLVKNLTFHLAKNEGHVLINKTELISDYLSKHHLI